MPSLPTLTDAASQRTEPPGFFDCEINVYERGMVDPNGRAVERDRGATRLGSPRPVGDSSRVEAFSDPASERDSGRTNRVRVSLKQQASHERKGAESVGSKGDKAKGAADKAKGKMEKATGDLTGDQKRKDRGQAKEDKGTLKKKKGQAKDLLS
ncbi:MAG TPA: hypothetical protein VK919_05505 [Solirubrobacterales bacterium]|nr:hypothetical protein [Solirubrobacterales bacterium]